MSDSLDSQKLNNSSFHILLFALFLTFAFAQCVQAQDFELYRPRSPQSSAGEMQPPDEPAPAVGDERVLVKQLKGLVFVDHPDKVVSRRLKVQGVQFEMDVQPELLSTSEFNGITARYLGGPVSIRRLNELAREIVMLYRANGQPVVDVSIPEQDITGGIVQLVVTEARVGDIRINAYFFSPCRLSRPLCISPGDPIYESQLMEDLRYLNLNPYREVNLRLTPGESFGETDIIFDVQDRRPVSAYVGYEDTGNRSTKLERTIYGLHWGNAFGLDHSLGYQFTASPDFSDLTAHSMSYTMPLRNRNEFVVYGSYATLNSLLKVGFPTDGYASELAFRYYHDLYPGRCSPRDHLQRRLLFGFDFRRTNTTLFFGQNVIFDSLADIGQFVVGYDSTRQTSWGTRRLGITGYLSPGGLTSFNNDAAHDALQPGASAEYMYARMFLEQTVVLPSNWQLYGKVTGQIADATMLSSEQLGLGGYNSIRGYDMRHVNGDQGWILNLEARTPVLQFFPCDRRHDLQGLVFFDYGEVCRKAALPPPAPTSYDLGSVGFGLRYGIHQRFHLRADYGWQLSKILPGVPRGSRLHVGAVATF
jgi:hemolysin activation/secretion protein